MTYSAMQLIDTEAPDSVCTANLLLNKRTWQRSQCKRISLCGTLLAADGSPLSTASIASKTANWSSDQAIAWLGTCSGFYALTIDHPKWQLAAVDHIRSLPLLYFQGTDQLYVSDDLQCLLPLVDDTTPDVRAMNLMAHTGYVLGKKTAVRGIKQLSAGQYLLVKKPQPHTAFQSRASIGQHFVLTYAGSSTVENTRTTFAQTHDSALQKVIRQLVETAAGRQLVLPLSGGYDSRILAVELAQNGYNNLLTYAYGDTCSREIAVSQQVASELGITWHCVTHDLAAWKRAWRTDSRHEYTAFAADATSLPHYQDWLAVKSMQEQSTIADDAMFCPGHTGDFIAGGHIPVLENDEDVFTIASLSHRIAHKHARLRYGSAPQDFIQDVTNSLLDWQREATGYACPDADLTPNDVTYLYQRWEWSERQAKYIVNSVRVYEYFGYAWWLPLWDKRYINTWSNAPLPLLHRRQFYIEEVNRRYQQRTGNTEQLGNADEGIWIRQPLLRSIKNCFGSRMHQRAATSRAILRRSMHLIKPPRTRALFENVHDSAADRWRLCRRVTPLGLTVHHHLDELQAQLLDSDK